LRTRRQSPALGVQRRRDESKNRNRSFIVPHFFLSPFDAARRAPIMLEGSGGCDAYTGPTVGIGDLPNELIALVMSHLPCVTVQLSCSLVCKRWLAMARTDGIMPRRPCVGPLRISKDLRPSLIDEKPKTNACFWLTVTKSVNFNFNRF
jgi:hypothetical protein